FGANPPGNRRIGATIWRLYTRVSCNAIEPLSDNEISFQNMIPEKIQALFDFIDYLDSRKAELIDKYLPLCDELSKLDVQRSNLKPRDNYMDKQKYDEIQKIIAEKFKPITQNIYIPVLNRLQE